MKKKLSVLLTILLLSLTVSFSFASTEADSIQIEKLSDGSYFITVIEDEYQTGMQPLAKKTVIKSKTLYHKNASGKTM